ncbi:MAG: hypothetical protein QOE03_2918 [Micromonosporaceae bacterium]|nr:hypothetical protein [Micromonosporaceae bacterium]
MSTPPEPNPQPRMRPTSYATLVVAALATAAVGWLVISNFYGDMPTLPWLPPLVMVGLAGVEIVLAVTTKARIDRREGTRPVDPLTVAWYVVLAKASSLGGALFTGVYGGLLVWLVPQTGTNTHVDHDLPQTIVGLVGAFGLTVGGLWLERACRVPPSPNDGTSADSGDPGADRPGDSTGYDRQGAP